MMRIHKALIAIAVTSIIAISFGISGKSMSRMTPDKTPPRSGNLMVLFRWERGTRKVVGTARNGPGTRTSQSSSVTPITEQGTREPKDGEFEVWFLEDGSSEAYCYEPARRVSARLDKSGRCGTTMIADERIAKAVAAAKPIILEPERTIRPQDSRSLTVIQSLPSRLSVLAGSSHVIAVGQVAGIVRMSHTPVNASGREQHTVFALAVEQYLKTDRFGMPAVRKIHQAGGDLPWTDHETGAKGIGQWEPTDPPLRVGERYILFLRWKGDGKGWPPFIVGTIGGVQGKIADMDEYEYTAPIRGKILLKDGMTGSVASTGRDEIDNWTFIVGPQILNVPEAEAIRAIKEELKNAGP